jgi:uncharacterized protein YcbK (DUF882 family)
VARHAGKLAAIACVIALGLAAEAMAQNRTVTVVRGAGSTPTVGWSASGGTQTAQALPTTGWAPTKVRSTIVIPQMNPGEPPTMSSPMQSSRYGAVPTAVLPRIPSIVPKPVPDDGSPRTLSLVHDHTGETITSTYWMNGRYIQGELQRLSQFLRDHRTGQAIQMDPDLMDLLVFMQRALKSSEPIRILSAYRSPATNAWLASISRGVASNSQHMHGNAIDIRIPGRSPAQLRAAALALGMGGVGYYPSSGFVHVDTGPNRQW